MSMFSRLNITKLIYFLSLIFSFNSTQLHSGGFLAGTLVKTSAGYAPIERLKIGDSILSYDFSECCVVESKVVQVTRRQVSVYTQLALNNQRIYTQSQQRFYALKDHKIEWVCAKNLTREFLLHNSNSDLVLLDANFERLETSLELVEVYSLTIAQYHNFFVTEQDFLVHNVGFVIPILTITFEGLVEWAGWTTLVSAAGAWLFGKALERNGVDTSSVRLEIKGPDDNDRNHYFGEKNREKHNFNDQDPDKILEIAKQLLLEEAKKGKLPAYGKFLVSTAIQTGGELVVEGWIANDVARYGTMYITK